MKKLVVLTTGYPFDKVEPFLESEIKYYPEEIEINIFPINVVVGKSVRRIERANVNVIEVCPRINAGLLRKVTILLRMIKALFCPLTWKEIKVLFNQHRLSINTIKMLLLFVSKGNHAYQEILQHLKKWELNEDDEIIFYAYWLHTHAFAAVRLKEKFVCSKAVARCHRFDLYEYVNAVCYIPMRGYILPRLDKIFSISTDGVNYLKAKYPDIPKAIDIARLGTRDCGLNPGISRKSLKIVSCSWVVRVKRINRIITALSHFTDVEIEWTHFGNGALFDELKQKADAELPKNIKYNLPGAISNAKIMDYYKNNPVHIFINVSESEGIPVSIMEAISFGIPVIATDVGGVNEIVTNGYNGLLLQKDFTIDDLVESIRMFICMEQADYEKYRNNARKYWNENYNSNNTYPKFIAKLLEMTKES